MTTREGPDQCGLNAVGTHPSPLTLQLDPRKLEILSQSLGHSGLDFLFLPCISAVPESLSLRSRCEIDVPDLRVWISGAVKERPTDVLPEDAPVLWRWPVCAQDHLSLRGEIMVGHPRTEVAFLMRSSSHDAGMAATVPPLLSCLEEEVDPVPWKLLRREGPPHRGQQPMTWCGLTAPP